MGAHRLGSLSLNKVQSRGSGITAGVQGMRRLACFLAYSEVTQSSLRSPDAAFVRQSSPYWVPVAPVPTIDTISELLTLPMRA
jgi:hypothetical protein